MTELDTDRLASLFTASHDSTGECGTEYVYKNRLYRLREVTVTIGEMCTKGGDWIPLPHALTKQLLCEVAEGEAMRAT